MTRCLRLKPGVLSTPPKVLHAHTHTHTHTHTFTHTHTNTHTHTHTHTHIHTYTHTYTYTHMQYRKSQLQICVSFISPNTSQHTKPGTPTQKVLYSRVGEHFWCTFGALFVHFWCTVCVLFHTAVCCSVVQCVAVCCSVVQCGAVTQNIHTQHDANLNVLVKPVIFRKRAVHVYTWGKTRKRAHDFDNDSLFRKTSQQAISAKEQYISTDEL